MGQGNSKHRRIRVDNVISDIVVIVASIERCPNKPTALENAVREQ